MIKINRILCPTDFSDASTAAFSYAIELARLFDAEVCFIHVVPVLPPPPADFSFESELLVFASALTKDAEQRLHKFLAERIPKKLKYRGLVVQGHAAEEILASVEGEGIDLITIATHGLTGWRHLIFGSVAEKIVRLASVPVLTVRCPDSNEQR